MIDFFKIDGHMGRVMLIAKHDLDTPFVGGPFLTNMYRIAFNGDSLFFKKIGKIGNANMYKWFFSKFSIESIEVKKTISHLDILIRKLDEMDIRYSLRMSRTELYIYTEDYDKNYINCREKFDAKYFDIE